MKHTILVALCLIFTRTAMQAQTPRVTLYEEFTGENCPPSASTDPGLHTVMMNNSSLVIPITWMVPYPSAPSNSWAPYRVNQAENEWRYKPSGSGGYGYMSQMTPTDVPASGVYWIPSGYLDGQHCWVFGAASDHAQYISGPVVAAAQSQTTNFSITLNPTWSLSYTSCIVTVTISSSTSFTAMGNLMFRLCLIERVINYPTAPGTTTQQVYYDIVRKSYPTTLAGLNVTSMGTPINNTWTPAQTQTLSINCNIPNYIMDLSQMAFVGFIQDDGDKKVYQAERSAQAVLNNDAKLQSVSINTLVQCSSTLAPAIVVKNNGANAISAFTVTPYVNGVSGSAVTWTGNLSVAASTLINLGTQTFTSGANTFSININNVSGGDVNLGNNTASMTVKDISAYGTSSIAEGFDAAVFPPAGWGLVTTFSASTWMRSTMTGGYGTNSESMYAHLKAVPLGVRHDMHLPGTSFTGTIIPTFKFDMAYIQWNTGDNDSLQIFASSDCGSSWSSVWGNSGNAMATAPPSSLTNMLPAGSQWTTVVIPLTTYSNNPDVLIRIRAKGGVSQGNSIWMDNINLYDAQQIGFDERTMTTTDIELFPNPATAETSISIHSPSLSEMNLKVTNALGKLVHQQPIKMDAGANSVKLNCKDLSNGIYLISLECEGTIINKKLVVSK
jgi:hypothetical protein